MRAVDAKRAFGLYAKIVAPAAALLDIGGHTLSAEGPDCYPFTYCLPAGR